MAKDANGVVIAVGDRVAVSAKVINVPDDGATLIVHTDTGVVGTTAVVSAANVVKQ
jgi:hypothetical protein